MSGLHSLNDNAHGGALADSELSDKLIKKALARYGVRLTPRLVAAVREYARLLMKWNQRISLTSLTDPVEILERHFGESMFAARAVPIVSGRLFDVGSGAGFPGLALRLACPDLAVTLIEPNVKKAVFLAEVCRALELEGVEIVRERIEEMSGINPPADFVTARAVGHFDRILKYASQALGARGQLVLWLGEADAQHVASMPGWSWRKPVSIPRSERRVLLVAQQSTR